MMKQILITGVNSYIGNSLEGYLKTDFNQGQAQGTYHTEKISLREENWQQADFSRFDSLVHVAGIAHSDVGKVSEEEKEKYYQINCDLTVRVAEKAKAEKVRQFIYMSSVIVYGDSAKVGKQKRITGQTPPAPANFYGDSKWQAEQKLLALASEEFRVAIVRAPMIYGADCKGNFNMLCSLARKVPFFPKVNNERSMLYIENLTEFLRLLIDSGKGGTFVPQNAEYVGTSRMVQAIGKAYDRRVSLWRIGYPFVWLLSRVPGRIGGLVNKAFGSLTIEQDLSGAELGDYRRYSLEESILRSIKSV